MNILLINHYAGSPFHGMEYRPYHFALEWIKAGHKVIIIAASFSHLRSFQPKCIDPITIEYIDGIRYIWLRTLGYDGNGPKRIINMLSFSWQLYFKSPPLEKIHLVIDSSTYPLSIYGSNRIAKMCGAKLIFEVHDLWPLTPMELGGYSRWHPFITIMQTAENYAYKCCDMVVSILPNALEHMVSHGLEPQKFIHIPNGISVSAWEDIKSVSDEHDRLINTLKNGNLFVLGYAGGHGISNALETLIDAADKLKEESIAFVLVGKGPEKEKLRAKASGLNKVFFLPPVPKTCIPALLRKMDVLYVGWQKNPLYRYGISPNKIMDYMMSEKPIIHSVEAANDIVAESGCGLSVPAGDPSAVADAIKKLSRMTSEELKEMGEKGRKYVLSNHDYRILSKRFLQAKLSSQWSL